MYKYAPALKVNNLISLHIGYFTLPFSKLPVPCRVTGILEPIPQENTLDGWPVHLRYWKMLTNSQKTFY